MSSHMILGHRIILHNIPADTKRHFLNGLREKNWPIGYINHPDDIVICRGPAPFKPRTGKRWYYTGITRRDGSPMGVQILSRVWE